MNNFDNDNRRGKNSRLFLNLNWDFDLPFLGVLLLIRWD